MAVCALPSQKLRTAPPVPSMIVFWSDEPLVTLAAHGNASGCAPNVIGDINHEAKLPALVIEGDRIADIVAGEPALRAQ
jgi:hypothetical protein